MGVLLITDFSYGAMLPFSVPGLKSVYSYLNGAGKNRIIIGIVTGVIASIIYAEMIQPLLR